MAESSRRPSDLKDRRLWRFVSRYFNDRAMFWLLPAVILGSGLLMWQLSRQTTGLYREMALQGAGLQAKTIEGVRQAYATEVVDRLKALDVEAKHQADENECRDDQEQTEPEEQPAEIGAPATRNEQAFAGRIELQTELRGRQIFPHRGPHCQCGVIG